MSLRMDSMTREGVFLANQLEFGIYGMCVSGRCRCGIVLCRVA
jgi:hypothetical protein